MNSRGNVLFLILIAVALFAALFLAVSSSTRTSGGTITKDKAQIAASNIIQYGAALRSAIVRMKVSNNCAENMFNFSNSTFQNNASGPLNGGNVNAPAGNVCRLFDPAGGNVPPVVVESEALVPNTGVPTNWKNGHGAIRVMQMTGVGTTDVAGTVSANDVVFLQNYLKREVCLAINELSDVPNPGGEPPAYTMSGTSGTYSNGSLAGNALVDDASVNGKTNFCHYDTNGAQYQYLTVILER